MTLIINDRSALSFDYQTAATSSKLDPTVESFVPQHFRQLQSENLSLPAYSIKCRGAKERRLSSQVMQTNNYATGIDTEIHTDCDELTDDQTGTGSTVDLIVDDVGPEVLSAQSVSVLRALPPPY